MNQKDENLTGHSYDGIEEYDNPLPRWWLLSFFGTIIFAVIYWAQYEIFHAPTQLAELKLDLAEIKAKYQTSDSSPSGSSDEELKQLMGIATSVAHGKEVFQSKCAVCHGVELQGIIGPNLVDEFWLHGGGKLTDIMVTIQKGVPEKGMPGWELLLKIDELKTVVAYIGANIGTKPANPKAPQGEKIVSP